MQKHQQAKTIDNGKRQASATKWGKIRKQNEARSVGGGKAPRTIGVGRGGGVGGLAIRPQSNWVTWPASAICICMSGRKIQRAVRYMYIYMRCGQDRDRETEGWKVGRQRGWERGKERGGSGDRLPTGGVQVCPARPSAHDFTVFRPLLINFRPSGICKVTRSGKHTQHLCTEQIIITKT